jgi:hypothetical protein
MNIKTSCGLSLVGVWQWLVNVGRCEEVGGGVQQGVGAGSSAKTMCGQGRAIKDRIALVFLAIISGYTSSLKPLVSNVVCILLWV